MYTQILSLCFKSVQASRSSQCTVVGECLTNEEEMEEEMTGDDGEASAEELEQIKEFDGEEELHTTAFVWHRLMRLSCFSHTLQLVVMSFNKQICQGTPYQHSWR